MTFDEIFALPSSAIIYDGVYGVFPAVLTPLKGTEYGVHTCLNRRYCGIHNELVLSASLVVFISKDRFAFIGGPAIGNELPEPVFATTEVVENFKNVFMGLGGGDDLFREGGPIAKNTNRSNWTSD